MDMDLEIEIVLSCKIHAKFKIFENNFEICYNNLLYTKIQHIGKVFLVGIKQTATINYLSKLLKIPIIT